MKNMNLLYILDIFPKISETFILNEIIELENRGFIIHVLSLRKPKENIYHDQFFLLKRKVIYLEKKNDNKLHKLFHLLRYVVKNNLKLLNILAYLNNFDEEIRWNFYRIVSFVQLINKHKIKHIHSHFAGQATECAMCLSLLTNIPFSFTTHGYDVYFSPHRYYKILVEKSKFTIAATHYNKKYLIEKYDVNPKKIEVVRCGIDVNIWKPDYSSFKDIDIITVGRLHPVKGLQYLLKACKDVVKEHNNIRCVIIGEGDERDNLQNFIDENRLGKNVTLIGAKSQCEVRSFLLRSKIFVLPSISEAMPVALMESLACEVPVIATKVRGVPELVEHGVNGFLVDAENSNHITMCLKKLLSDENLRAFFGKNGRLKVEHEFNSVEEINKLTKLIDI